MAGLQASTATLRFSGPAAGRPPPPVCPLSHANGLLRADHTAETRCCLAGHAAIMPHHSLEFSAPWASFSIAVVTRMVRTSDDGDTGQAPVVVLALAPAMYADIDLSPRWLLGD
jgi:hypothetical protein